jgi:hypothetical protein
MFNRARVYFFLCTTALSFAQKVDLSPEVESAMPVGCLAEYITQSDLNPALIKLLTDLERLPLPYLNALKCELLERHKLSIMCFDYVFNNDTQFSGVVYIKYSPFAKGFVCAFDSGKIIFNLGGILQAELKEFQVKPDFGRPVSATWLSGNEVCLFYERGHVIGKLVDTSLDMFKRGYSSGICKQVSADGAVAILEYEPSDRLPGAIRYEIASLLVNAQRISVHTAFTLDSAACMFSLSRNGKTIVYLDAAKKVHVVERNEEVTLALPDEMETVACDPLGRICAAAHKNKIYLRALENGDMRTLSVPAPVTVLEWDFSGQYLAVGTSTGWVYLYDREDNRLKPMHKHKEPVRGVSFSSCNSWVSTCDASEVKIVLIGGKLRNLSWKQVVCVIKCITSSFENVESNDYFKDILPQIKAFEGSLATIFPVLAEQFARCSICSDSVTDSFTIPCNHRFCKYCIFQILKERYECPLCRGRIASIFAPDGLYNLICEINLTKELKQ